MTLLWFYSRMFSAQLRCRDLSYRQRIHLPRTWDSSFGRTAQPPALPHLNVGIQLCLKGRMNHTVCAGVFSIRHCVFLFGVLKQRLNGAYLDGISVNSALRVVSVIPCTIRLVSATKMWRSRTVPGIAFCLVLDVMRAFGKHIILSRNSAVDVRVCSAEEEGYSHRYL